MHLTAEQLDQYVHEELPNSEHTQASDHLVSCSECSARAVALRNVVAMLRASQYAIGPKPTLECPSERTLNDFAAGVIHGERREKLERHFATCEFCKSVLPTAEELHQFETYLDEQTPSPAARKESDKKNSLAGWVDYVRSYWKPLAIACASLALILFVVKKPTERERETFERGGGELGVVQVLSPEDSTTESLPFEFRWEKYENATRYRVVIMPDDQPEVSEEVFVEETRVSSTQFQKLVPNKTYRWSVQARIGTTELAKSEFRSVVVK